MPVPCPGFQEVDQDFGASAQGADPVQAVTRALFALGMEIGERLRCDGDCDQVLSDPIVSEQAFQLRRLDSGDWLCVLGLNMNIEVDCVQPAGRKKRDKKLRWKDTYEESDEA